MIYPVGFQEKRAGNGGPCVPGFVVVMDKKDKMAAYCFVASDTTAQRGCDGKKPNLKLLNGLEQLVFVAGDELAGMVNDIAIFVQHESLGQAV